MKKIAFVLMLFISLISKAELSFFDWEYPEDPKDSDWYIIYGYVSPTLMSKCISLLNPGTLDCIVDEFAEKYPAENRTDLKNFRINTPTDLRLFADELNSRSFKGRTIITLAELAGISSTVFDISGGYHWPPTYTVKNSSPLIEWYYKHKHKIDLDLLGLYLAEDSRHYVYDPTNDLSLYGITRQHFNHPMNNLNGEDEQRLLDLAYEFEYIFLSPDDHEFVDRIIKEYPNNEIIRILMRNRKFYQFGIMAKNTLKKGVED